MATSTSLQSVTPQNLLAQMQLYADQPDMQQALVQHVAGQISGAENVDHKDVSAYRELFGSSDFQKVAGAERFIKDLRIGLIGASTGTAKAFIATMPAPKKVGVSASASKGPEDRTVKPPSERDASSLSTSLSIFGTPIVRAPAKLDARQLDMATKNCGRTAALVLQGLSDVRQRPEVPMKEVLASLSKPATQHEVWDITVHQHTFTLERYPGVGNLLIQAYQPGYNVQHWMGLGGAQSEAALSDLPKQWRQPSDEQLRSLAETITDLFEAPPAISWSHLVNRTKIREEAFGAAAVALGINPSQPIHAKEIDRIHLYFLKHLEPAASVANKLGYRQFDVLSKEDVDKIYQALLGEPTTRPFALDLQALASTDVSRFNDQRGPIWAQLPFNPTDPFMSRETPAFLTNHVTFSKDKEPGESARALLRSMSID